METHPSRRERDTNTNAHRDTQRVVVLNLTLTDEHTLKHAQSQSKREVGESERERKGERGGCEGGGEQYYWNRASEGGAGYVVKCITRSSPLPTYSSYLPVSCQTHTLRHSEHVRLSGQIPRRTKPNVHKRTCSHTHPGDIACRGLASCLYSPV